VTSRAADRQRYTQRQKTAQALALRARIVLGCASALSNKAVAGRARVTAQAVGKWRQHRQRHARPAGSRGSGSGQAAQDRDRPQRRAPAGAGHGTKSGGQTGERQWRSEAPAWGAFYFDGVPGSYHPIQPGRPILRIVNLRLSYASTLSKGCIHLIRAPRNRLTHQVEPVCSPTLYSYV
jgi:hypothetical protein